VFDFFYEHMRDWLDVCADIRVAVQIRVKASGFLNIVVAASSQAL
jgi:hypothetical protein